MKLSELQIMLGDVDFVELIKKLGENVLAEQKSAKPKSVWELNVGDKFWYLTSIGNISETTYCCGGDDVKIAQGNAFLTSENTRAEIMRLWGDGE